MAFNLDIINIFILVIVILNSILGLFIFVTNKNSNINQNFFIFSIAATFWGLSMFIFRGTLNPQLSFLFVRILYVSAALIPFVFLFFIRVFPLEKFGLNKKIIFLLGLPFLAICTISILPGYLILGVTYIPGSEKIILFNQTYHTIYALYIMLYFSLCYLLLINKYIKSTGIEKIQVTYVILGTFISTIIGVCTNLVMPYLHDFSLNWMGQIGIIIMVGSISYSIVQHKLFAMKVVATQFIVFILCTSLFARTLFSSSKSDLTINISFLIITIIISFLLLRSVINEVNQRQKLELITTDLENANNRLKELDQLKSEFLSLATHQIRAPLTAVKGYASLILEGDYGKITPGIREAVQTIFNSCQNLVGIVGDFLDISRIEQGKMKYDIVTFDGLQLVKNIIKELGPNIQKAGLQIDMKIEGDEKAEFHIHADEGKTRQVVGNIIDNAIKYTPHGMIHLSVSRTDTTTRIAVTDSGIGIAQEEIPKLFAKFVRAKDANKTNVIGTGLGLYVAKQMVEAQGGKIWVESAGVGTGSTFFVEMPSQ